MTAGWRVRRLTNGSTIVAKRVRRSFIPLDEDGEIRLLATVLRCGPALYAVPKLLDLAHQSPIWLAGGTCLWGWTAWRAGTATPAEPTTANRTTEEHETEPAIEADPADLRQAVIDRLLGWMEERPGIHLSEVYDRYRALPGHEALTDGQIRTSLIGHYEIPWRRAVADPRKTEKRTRAGIHRDDLQPLPSPAGQAPATDSATADLTSSVAA